MRQPLADHASAYRSIGKAEVSTAECRVHAIGEALVGLCSGGLTRRRETWHVDQGFASGRVGDPGCYPARSDLGGRDVVVEAKHVVGVVPLLDVAQPLEGRVAIRCPDALDRLVRCSVVEIAAGAGRV